jgi:hypothetical protein
MNRQTFITSSRVVMQAMVTLRSTTGVIISRIARSMASGTILSENNVFQNLEKCTSTSFKTFNKIQYSQKKISG